MALPTNLTVQSSYSLRPAEAMIGQFAVGFNPQRVQAKLARGLIKAGYGVFKPAAIAGANRGAYDMADPGGAAQVLNPTAITAATTAILATGGVSSAAVQVISGAALNGSVGQGEMFPARQVTFILNNNAAWLATVAVLKYLNAAGQVVSENLTIPAGGNATVTSVGAVRQVLSLTIPIQTGAGGTYTLGIAAISAFAATDFLGVACRQPIKNTISANSLYGYPGMTSNLIEADYIPDEAVPVLTMGDIWVFCEEAVTEGDPVYVRITSGAGGSNIGAFRKSADTATAVLISNAVFRRQASAGGPAWARFQLI